MSAKTPRKFAPVPIEESTKSSRDREEPVLPEPKPRRFAPEPVEEITRSSKDKATPPAEAEKPKPRRFAVETVEETTRSPKDHNAPPGPAEKPKPRRFAVQPVEETTRSSKDQTAPSEQVEKPKPRRFAVKPVEETTRSSKDHAPPSNQVEKPKPRRFAPEPVEHTTKSSKAGNGGALPSALKAKPRRFAPQLVEDSSTGSESRSSSTKTQHVKFKPELVATTYGSNRASKRRGSPSEPRIEVEEPEAGPKPPRKFTPILLDTATRSRRAGDANAPLSQDYRTEYGYHAHPHDHWRRVNGEETPTVASEQDPDADATEVEHATSRSSRPSGLRALAPLDGSAPKRASCFKTPQRQHSFRAPDLETIESSESEEDIGTSSSSLAPSRFGSYLTTTTSYDQFKHATRRRESIDDSYQHYLLELESKKAQQKLEEQALAAFPNVDFGYEHPDHFFHDDDDSGEFEIEERPVTWEGNEDDLLEMARRESTTNMWEMGELRRHAEVQQQERNANRITAKQPSRSPWGRRDSLNAAGEPTAEMKSMLDRARPPMLGSELVFPRCASPGPARFDVTQGSAALRDQMCYLTAAAEAEKKRSGEEEGLWTAKQPESKRPNTLRTPGTPGSPATPGLWGGFCVDNGQSGTGFGGRATPSGITGLMTPRNELANPFQSMTPAGLTPPATPNRNKSRTDLQRLHSILVTEREIDNMMEREYPDSFVTQVYNYLSLGYPSLARAFDDELSKISRIPISELRQDDEKARTAPRGYIRLGPDFEGGGGEGMVEDSCMRWRALKRYVREWAKQEKNWEPTDGVGANWGTAVRRGSWGI